MSTTTFTWTERAPLLSCGQHARVCESYHPDVPLGTPCTILHLMPQEQGYCVRVMCSNQFPGQPKEYLRSIFLPYSAVCPLTS